MVIMTAGSNTERDLNNRKLLVVSLLRRNDWGIRYEHEVDARIGHEIGQELGNVDVERTIEAERYSERRGQLGEKAVEVGVGRALNIEVAAAHILERLIIEAEGNVSVFEQCMRREHRVVGLDDGVGDLRSW